MEWIEELKQVVKGDVVTKGALVKEYSVDTSIFKLKPEVVALPKDGEDVKAIVSFVSNKKEEMPELSLAARSAGTDMTGGPLSESIVVGFTKYFNHFSFDGESATVEPGVYYRDFEKESLKHGLLLPSYPASKSIAALGGLVNNNSAGERTLRYGQTNRYVEELSMVLADGNEYTMRSLSLEELEQKKAQENFEGEVYRKLHALFEEQYDAIQKAKPNVTKNASGYALWNVWNRQTFDLTQLFCGAQGTLGIMTRAKLRLVRVKPKTRLGVVFLKDLMLLPELVNELLPLEPESLEIFDDETLKLALRFFPEIAKRVEGENLFSFALQFIPEFFIGVQMLGLPKLIMLAEFAEETDSVADDKLSQFHEKMERHGVLHRLIGDEKEAEKYWVMRRESFNLLRQHVKDKRMVPFVEDVIVSPEHMPEVIPKLYDIMRQYGIHTTLAGHAGNGNLHIIPLMDLSQKKEREKLRVVADKIYDLVLSYGGSISAEHNDGLIRGPYVEQMFGSHIYSLFCEVKDILDPKNIFNPGKKINVDFEYAMRHVNAKG